MADIMTLIEKANKNDSDAMCELGRLYYNGESVKQDYKKALEYFEKAVWTAEIQNKKNYIAAYFAGYGFSSPVKGFSANYEDAFYYYLYAAKGDDPDAQDAIARAYNHIGVWENTNIPEYNPYTGNIWAQKAIKNGSADACALYSYNLLNAVGCGEDIFRAAEYAEIGAKKGNIACMWNCVAAYESNINHNVDRATYWLSELVKEGESEASNHLNSNYVFSSWRNKWIERI